MDKNTSRLNEPSGFAFPETLCHRLITGDPDYYPQAEYQGRKLFFCTEVCQRVFLEDPEVFIQAHGKQLGDSNNGKKTG
jgi:YHS domain-containing protein